MSASANHRDASKITGGAAPGDAVRFVLLDSGNVRSTFALTADRLVIGREDENDIVLADPRVSKCHAAITVEGGEVVLQDLGSSNGTRVNEHKVRAQSLMPGDIIRIGHTVILCLTKRMPGRGPSAKAHGFIVGDVPGEGWVSLPVSDVPLLAGRAPEAVIRASAPESAEFMAQIVDVPGGAQFTDLTSKVPRCAVLTDGQCLDLGEIQLEFRVSGSGLRKRRGTPLPQSASDPHAPAKPPAPAPKARGQARPAARDTVSFLAETGQLSKELEREADFADAAPPAHPVPNRPASTPRSGRCALTGLTGPHQGQSFSIPAEPFTLGRAPGCSLRLDDEEVSRCHARIVRVEGDVVIEDLRSANGIFLNGRRVKRHPIKPGDRIRIGRSEFLVHL